MKKRFSWKALIVSFVIVYLVAFIGSLLTTNSVNSQWYETIKPSITPPSYVFPIVWNILFFLIALSLYFAWTNSKNKNTKKRVAFLFGLNFALNILWSFLYFYLKNPASAFFELIALWFSIVLMINLIYKINKKASWLLVPYLLWVSFAGILNYLSVYG